MFYSAILHLAYFMTKVYSHNLNLLPFGDNPLSVRSKPPHAVLDGRPWEWRLPSRCRATAVKGERGLRHHEHSPEGPNRLRAPSALAAAYDDGQARGKGHRVALQQEANALHQRQEGAGILTVRGIAAVVK